MSRLLLLIFSLVKLASSEVYFSKGFPHVQLSQNAIISGSLKYSRDGRPFSSFTGIPYATFSERFAASQLITDPSWDGVKSFTQEEGPVCSQEGYGNSGQEFYGEEDCLVLNVHVPMNNSGDVNGYPVLVWIHGGGFMYGAGSEYGARFYMDEDVLLVTINYRLGVFGFLSTGDEVVPGNNGLKDQATALKWVQKNIEKFGGNSGRVVIAGESAGSASVSYQLISPMSNGLFHGAISQSASALGDYPYEPKPKENAIKLADFVGCPTTSSADMVHCLKQLSSEELNRAQFTYKSSFPKNYTSFNFVPTVETATGTNSPAFLSVPPVTAFQSGTDIPLMKVPWMIGVTEDEGCSAYAGAVLAEEDLIHELNTEWETIAPEAFFYTKYVSGEERQQVSEKLRNFYFGEKNGKISLETRKSLTDLYSDQLITHAVWKAAMESAKRGNTVYLYEYAYPGPVSLFAAFCKITPEEAKMVGHADELQHQFELFGLSLEPDSEDEKFSRNFVKLWASFIKHLKPQHSWKTSSTETSIWKPISKAQIDGSSPKKWFRIEGNQAAYIEVHNGLLKRMNFWDGLWKDHFAPAIERLYKKQLVQTDSSTKTEL